MGSELDNYSKQTNRRLIVGFVLILLLLGDGLIYLLYGKGAAITGLICIGGGFIPIIFIWGSLAVIDKIARKSRVDEVE